MTMPEPQARAESRAPEETRDRILAAAREVIARKGKHGATTREIASSAGVNEATLFRHFGSKESLILAVIQHACGASELRNVADQLSGSVEDDLFVLARTMMSRMDSIRDMLRWSLVEEDFEQSSVAFATWRPHLAIYEVVHEYMARAIAAGTLHGDSKRLTLVFMGFVFAQVMAAKKFPVEEYYGSKDAAVKFFVNVFLNGVRSK